MVRKTRQSGQALVAATFGLVALLGATGLAIDMGFLRYQKRLQQSAADSAALAAAGDVAYAVDGANITTAATNDAALNGFTGGNVTVTVHNPYTPPATPANPTPAANADAVEVLVSVNQPVFFMKIFGIPSVNVTARAVALASGKNCIYALQNGISGTPTFPPAPPPPCGIIDNQALVAQGAVPAADPLSYLQPPPIPAGACTTSNLTGSAGASPPLPFTLFPGNYCAISITGNADVTFKPGTYILTGAGISFNGKGSVMGAGVTFYLHAGAVSINTAGASSNEAVNLTAPTTAPYPGILFYQDPADALSATIDGKGATTLEGALYFPSAALALKHTGTGAAYTIAVTKSLALSGATHFPANYSSLPGGSPVKTGVLVE
jgi:Putative Flp pilus-assembly TadE/G-like